MLQVKVTWTMLVILEPRLKDLQSDINRIAKEDTGNGTFCANHVWYKPGSFKDRLCKLVGWDAEKDIALLKSEAAYDLAYKKLYNLLPDCRNCSCL